MAWVTTPHAHWCPRCERMAPHDGPLALPCIVASTSPMTCEACEATDYPLPGDDGSPAQKPGATVPRRARQQRVSSTPPRPDMGSVSEAELFEATAHHEEARP